MVDNYKRQATCHPEKKYHAKGLCRSCYIKGWAKRNGYMYQRIWNGTHPEKIKEIRIRYRKNNRGKINRRQYLKRMYKKGFTGKELQ